MTTYAVNGLGRMGKLALRPLIESGAKIAFINDAEGDPEMHAHLLEFDSIHGRWPAAFAHDATSISIDGQSIPITKTRTLEDLPLDGVDVVIDCTGAFKTEAKLAPYFAAGVKKVVVSAPVKDGPTANIVYGVNDDIYDPATHDIITAASCTTNCIAPVVKVLLDGIGIKHGSITTIQDVTTTHTMVDRPAKE
jgi:glyceraldehyde 3-phosphate dehydrogenase